VNVILVTIDCLRADHVGCYGYPRDTTPFIDSLAKEGMCFENAFANGPFTVVSFPSILASAYPLDFKNLLPFPEDAVLISEILQKKGIRTAAIHSNPYLSAFYGYNRGWDYFEDFLQSSNTKEEGSKRIRRSVKKFFPRKVADLYFFLKLILGWYEPPYKNAEIITNHAVRWLGSNEKTFFLWLHYMDLHEPYCICNANIKRKYSKNVSKWSQAKLLRKKDISHEDVETIINIYDDKLRYLDDCLKQLFHFLNNEELADDTIIILTSDHGQEFLDHGHYGHNAKFYNELLHIPLILFGPGIEKRRTDKLVSQIDIAPTILYFYGIPPPREYRGHNLLSEHVNEYVISEAVHDEKGTYIQSHEISQSKFRTYAVITKNWKYIHKGNKCELYDLINDPKEKYDVSDTHKEIVKSLSKILDRHLTKRRRFQRERIKEKIKKLKSLRKI